MIQPFRYPRSLNRAGAAGSRGDQRPHRDGGGQIRRDRSQREARPRRYSRNRVRHADAAIAASGAAIRSCKIPKRCRRWRSSPGTICLPTGEAQALSTAYCWLRDVEHRLQMENNLQTHTIPTERRARERLAVLMGCARPWRNSRSVHRQHTDRVRRTLRQAAQSGRSQTSQRTLPDLDTGPRANGSIGSATASFRDPEKAYQLIREFVQGPGYVHVSPRTAELAMRLLPRLLALCPDRRS